MPRWIYKLSKLLPPPSVVKDSAKHVTTSALYGYSFEYKNNVFSLYFFATIFSE
ncbi:hypothetical protein RO3G_10136 [Rhizopus delemar RA 99-880]|uniref:Uncharacterized protein n=1 Tax=Rhizopus delemar (strain RA 99-880 / ATCC MYA-4621 / FGSC 9543 / NRRL 43880) TaxID=246409 RepID=I1CAE6_RHIO9|nr:hypothetical protein RO3G_10136 [Rhizopus delemar RA 99-880]|eukprot:EIE85426.1 hypothetical protein RO3G_10136 [Rhizopus delemar RA 99-880]